MDCDTLNWFNRRLLQTILKDKIGFKGFVMSDWWSINNDNYEHFANGCDMNMPGDQDGLQHQQEKKEVIGIK